MRLWSGTVLLGKESVNSCESDLVKVLNNIVRIQDVELLVRYLFGLTLTVVLRKRCKYGRYKNVSKKVSK